MQTSTQTKLFSLRPKIFFQHGAANIELDTADEVYFIKEGLELLHQAQNSMFSFLDLVERHRKKKLQFSSNKKRIISMKTFMKVIYGKKSKGFFLKLAKLSKEQEKNLSQLKNCYAQCEKYLLAYQDSKCENQWTTAEISFRYVRAKYYRECYEKLSEQYQRALCLLKRYFPYALI